MHLVLAAEPGAGAGGNVARAEVIEQHLYRNRTACAGLSCWPRVAVGVELNGMWTIGRPTSLLLAIEPFT